MEISSSAIDEIKRMQIFRQQTDRNFRIGLASGGCKKFHYTIDLIDSIDDTDKVYNLNGVAVSIDSQDLQYLDRLKLDYSEDLMGGGFRFQNPRATSVCGCGNSFDI